jgi:hypothetical protein
VDVRRVPRLRTARGCALCTRVALGAAAMLLATLVRTTTTSAFSFSDELDESVTLVPSTAVPLYGLLSRACPDSRVQAHELDAVRTVEGKLAIAAALRAAARSEKKVRFGQARPDGEIMFANTPREVATAVRDGLGATSFVSRGVDALASIADAAEYTAQVPLDQVNLVTELLATQGRRWGLRNFPIFRFRSRIENDRAGVILSARW